MSKYKIVDDDKSHLGGWEISYKEYSTDILDNISYTDYCDPDPTDSIVYSDYINNDLEIQENIRQEKIKLRNSRIDKILNSEDEN